LVLSSFLLRVELERGLWFVRVEGTADSR